MLLNLRMNNVELPDVDIMYGDNLLLKYSLYQKKEVSEQFFLDFGEEFKEFVAEIMGTNQNLDFYLWIEAQTREEFCQFILDSLSYLEKYSKGRDVLTNGKFTGSFEEAIRQIFNNYLNSLGISYYLLQEYKLLKLISKETLGVIDYLSEKEEVDYLDFVDRFASDKSLYPPDFHSEPFKPDISINISFNNQNILNFKALNNLRKHGWKINILQSTNYLTYDFMCSLLTLEADESIRLLYKNIYGNFNDYFTYERFKEKIASHSKPELLLDVDIDDLKHTFIFKNSNYNLNFHYWGALLPNQPEYQSKYHLRKKEEVEQWESYIKILY